MATLMNNTGKIIATDIYQHKLDKIKDRLSDDFYSSIDDEYDSKPNFNDIVYRIIHLYNTT